eukprot:2671142-Pyramimonas_sp.AAC.1
MGWWGYAKREEFVLRGCSAHFQPGLKASEFVCPVGALQIVSQCPGKHICNAVRCEPLAHRMQHTWLRTFQWIPV